ncbi:hypothetical protein [Streptomyces sp. 8N706]|uniref:hypothetical protein n=1 Tax=Streptomyces sp. 8N706 TaxID=3457416 RepID=UPI003FD005CB
MSVLDEEGIEVISSDAPAPFTMVPEWVIYSPLKPAQRMFYCVLASCVNHGRSDRTVWPAGPELADAMGLSNPDQLKSYRQALQSIGAVSIREVRYAKGMRRRYVYDVRFHPPEGYQGPRSRQEWLARRAAQRAGSASAKDRDPAAFEASGEGKSAGRPGPPENRGAGPPKNGGAGTPKNGGAKPDQPKPDQLKPQTAPSARSAGERRRPSTGSRGTGLSGGCAAQDGGRAPRNAKPEILVRGAVADVVTGFPEPLRAAMRRSAGSGLPRTLVRQIEKELQEATPQRLVERVNRRWAAHNYAQLHAAGNLRRPVGAAVAMLRSGPCPDPRCEDGLLEDGSACRACIEREKDRKAGRSRARHLQEAEEPALRGRRGCRLCGEGQALSPTPCRECELVMSAAQERVARAAEEAAAVSPAHLACEAQAHIREVAERASRRVRAAGANALGQAIAARLAAETEADGLRAWRADSEEMRLPT